MVTLSSLLAALAAAAPITRLRPFKLPVILGVLVLFVFTVLDLGLRLTSGAGLSALELHISPYKSLSYALQYPGSTVTYRQWNAFTRVDVVRSGGIHSVPGLSYRYLQPLRRQDALL